MEHITATQRQHSGKGQASKSRIVLACLALASGLLLVDTVSFAGADAALDVHPELDRGVLGEGRQAYRERRDPARAHEAYRLFKAASTQHPDDPAAAWHVSMACYWLGLRVYTDPEQKKAAYAEGKEMADRALELDPNCGPCHLLTAVNHALWAEQVGIMRTIVGLGSVKAHLRRAAELDPAFAGAAAFRVQATILDRLPRMFGGGRGKARRTIEQAIAVAPNEPLNYEFLANMLVNKYRDVPRAVAVARRGLAVPEPGPEYVESRDSIAYLKHFVEHFSTQVTSSRH